jgi:UTP--glucose-1-phosphate uridylyltransferase
MAAVTEGKPKELLQLPGGTVLEFIINEAFEAGANQVVVVGSKAKPEIDEFVCSLGDARIEVKHQPEPLGLAHAVACAEVDGPLAVLLGDTIFWPGSPLNRLVEDPSLSAVAVQTVPDNKVNRYGIVDPDPEMMATRILEKPDPSEIDSRWAVTARFFLSERASELLQTNYRYPVPGPERTLTDLFGDLLAEGGSIRAIPIDETEERLDCGSVTGYREAKERLKR